MLKGKVLIIHLIFGLIKKMLYKMSYIPEPYIRGKNNIKVELNFSSYAINLTLKRQQGLINQNLLKRMI